MKISINATELKNVIEKMETFVGGNKFKCVQIDAENNEVTCSGTDSYQYISVKVNALIAEPGCCRIGIDDLKYMKKAKGDILIDSGNTEIKMRFGNKIMSFTKQEYEEIPKLESHGNLVLKTSQKWLYETFKKLDKFTSNSEANKTMQTFNFNVGENRVETLDNIRIGARDMEGEKGEESCMIHKIATKPLLKLLNKNGSEEVEILKDEKKIYVKADDFLYCQRMIEGKFFNTNELLSLDYIWEFETEKNGLKEIMKWDHDMLKSMERPVLMKMNNEEVSTYASTDRSKSVDVIPTKNEVWSDQCRIAFNPLYVIDALNCIESDDVVIKGISGKAPFVIEADDYKFVILPVGTKGRSFDW